MHQKCKKPRENKGFPRFWAFWGLPYYYLYALAVKVPLGTWFLIVLGTCSFILVRPRRLSTVDAALLLVPPILFVALVSAHTGFNHHGRYVLGALPFAFVWASQFAAWPSSRARKVISAAAVACVAASSLAAYPHGLSYYNEAAGGPARGSYHLLHSNTDWGQDLFALKRWCSAHSDHQPLFLAYDNDVDPTVAGIRFSPPLPVSRRLLDGAPPSLGDYPSGWYVLSVNFLHGYRHHVADGHGRRVWLSADQFRCFREIEPVDRIGYTMCVFRVDRVVGASRRKVGEAEAEPPS